MCYNCGCNMPEDDMGMGSAGKDPNGKSITEETFKVLATKHKQTITQIKQAALNQLIGNSNREILSKNILQQAAESQGMNLKETTEETIKLLKRELN